MVAVFLFLVVLLLVGIAGFLAYKQRDGWFVFLIIGGIIAYYGLLVGLIK